MPASRRHYVVKPLRWSEAGKQAWLEDVMRVIIDMYIEEQHFHVELPLFEHRKKLR